MTTAEGAVARPAESAGAGDGEAPTGERPKIGASEATGALGAEEAAAPLPAFIA
jgi:hypothetical protein